ncbi:hypothetical protein KC19_VG160300, partial [Ceratodon purpureus]
MFFIFFFCVNVVDIEDDDPEDAVQPSEIEKSSVPSQLNAVKLPKGILNVTKTEKSWGGLFNATGSPGVDYVDTYIEDDDPLNALKRSEIANASEASQLNVVGFTEAYSK